jgi:hypothetical protein
VWLIPASMSSVFAPAQRCSMREFASLCPRRGLWLTLSGKPSLKPFSWRGWLTRRWMRHLFGADLLKISNSGSGVERWTASLRVSLASRGARPETSGAPMMTDGSGQPSPAGSATPRSPSFSLRMCQGSLLDEESIAYSETLPDSGSMRSGFLFPQPTWEPPTSENESSFWPSTRAEDAESCGNHPASSHSGDSLTGVTRNWLTPHGFSAGNGPDGNEFSTQVRLWQTPASDSFRSRGGDRVDEMGLDQQARTFWPTPLSHDCESPRPPEQIAAMRERTGAGISNLNEYASTWPTTGANDHKGSAKEGQRRGQLDEAAEPIFSRPGPQIPDGQPSSPESRGSRRRLNPAFAAWLMGMPWWWTSIGPISSAQSGMESWRCRLRSRLLFLLGGS